MYIIAIKHVKVGLHPVDSRYIIQIMPETGNPNESPRPIEKPVTSEMIQRAADAGLVTEVFSSMRLAQNPISASEGGKMLSKAQKIEADRFDQQASLYQELSDLSDDPEWKKIYQPQADSLHQQASLNRDSAESSETAAKQLEGTGVPFVLKPLKK